MSSLDTVKNEGKLPSFFAAEMMLPMVDPADLGEAAARRMLEPVDSTEIRHVEGPQRNSAGVMLRGRLQLRCTATCRSPRCRAKNGWRRSLDWVSPKPARIPMPA